MTNEHIELLLLFINMCIKLRVELAKGAKELIKFNTGPWIVAELCHNSDKRTR